MFKIESKVLQAWKMLFVIGIEHVTQLVLYHGRGAREGILKRVAREEAMTMIPGNATCRCSQSVDDGQTARHGLEFTFRAIPETEHNTSDHFEDASSQNLCPL